MLCSSSSHFMFDALVRLLIVVASSTDHLFSRVGFCGSVLALDDHLFSRSCVTGRDLGRFWLVPASAFRVAPDEPGIEGTYTARLEQLPPGGREAALERLRELNVRYIIKPAQARAEFERYLGLTPRRHGNVVIFEIPSRGGVARDDDADDE